MPILAKVGRRAWRVRAVIFAIYALLSLGGLTMVLPFAIVLTGSVANEADYERYDVFPTWVWRRDLRFAKYLAEEYRGLRFEQFAVLHNAPADWSTFSDLGRDDQLAERLFAPARRSRSALTRIVADYNEFLSTYDSAQCLSLFAAWERSDLQAFLRHRYMEIVRADSGGALLGRALESAALERLIRTWNEGIYAYWDLIHFDAERAYPYHLPSWVPPDEPRYHDYLAYLSSLPASRKLPLSARYFWCLYLMNQAIRIAQIDQEYGTQFGSLYRVPPGDEIVLPPPLADLWQTFLREAWPARLTELTPAGAQGFSVFLEDKFRTLAAMNLELGSTFVSFDEVGSPTRLPEQDSLRRVWCDYVMTVPLAERRQLSPERAYRAFLLARYGTIEAVNEAYETAWPSILQIPLPQAEVDYLAFSSAQMSHAVRFLTESYRQALRFVALRGRALWNTLILVTLTILFTLIVNPLAAYALSRFRLRATQQILIYLLATMAFPPEVGMIPSFLLLRDLHLLNTFPALILPGLANGFSIFLLKGFFDSLPQELYEAAEIDGAGAGRIFFSISLPLSLPILAVIALQAFLAAYGSFMWAFLVCQEPKMWTLMVWLYQYQMITPPHAVMAALVLASIPTLIVFVTCQKVILRGIIIPTLK